jgi:hypothetical protein
MCLAPLMVRTLVITCCLLAPACGLASSRDSAICGARNAKSGTVFTLSINHVMRVEYRTVTFMLCARTWPGDSFLLVSSEAGNKSKTRLHKRIALNEAQYAEIESLYEASLDLNLRDDVDGMDGGDWCLETQRVSVDFRVCIWSPTVQTSERKLTNLAALGRKLWYFSEIDSTVGALN